MNAIKRWWAASKIWGNARQIGFAAVCILLVAFVVGSIAPPKPRTVTVATTVPIERTTSSGASVETSRTSVAKPVHGLAALRIVEPSGYPAYFRSLFGSGWRDEDGDCQDTRQEVLIRQSATSPALSDGGCSVYAGLWHDPWSKQTITDPGKLDVDHTVPLSNAWRSGAWAWSPSMRAAYANDLADEDHLLAIPYAENRSKGDGGPEDWKPPLKTDWCRYAKSWTRIKTKWDLSVTRPEWNALVQMADTC